MADTQQVRSFENLVCYQHAIKLFNAAYRLSERLPVHERYNLADQLRRAVLSTLANIAEGYGRYHYLDKLQFFYYARGSLCETLSLFISAYQAGYLDEEQLVWVRNMETEAEKSLNGYISFIRRQQLGKKEFGGRFLHDGAMVYQERPSQVDSPEKATSNR